MKNINWATFANVVTLASAIFASIWWTSKLDSRICTLEGFMRETQPQIVQLREMKQVDEQMMRTLIKIETNLDKLMDKMWELHTPDHRPLKDLG